MTETNPKEPVRVVVTERPQTVTVTHRGVRHFAYWRTEQPMRKVEGDGTLLHAAMCCWDGHTNEFTVEWDELAFRSGGWLPKAGSNGDGTPLAETSAGV